MRRIDWAALLGGVGVPADGEAVSVEGHGVPGAMPDGYMLLMPEPGCCAGCRPEPDCTIEVLLDGTAWPGRGPVRVTGEWRRLPAEDPAGWRWQVRKARVASAAGFGRRAMLAAPLLCAVPRMAGAQEAGAGRALLAGMAAMDLHSHAGRVIISRQGERPLAPLAGPMREGGMALVALAMVADTPVTHVVGQRIEAAREPAEGELWAHGERAFARLQRLVAEQGLAVVADRPALARAMQRGAGPSVVVAAEGADFLEGRLERLEQIFRSQRLRHLQLVHYRVNALGDIQTAAPVHGGLTKFGEAVVRECNRLGIVVDIAHATLPLVRRAAEVSTRPLVLSHTALSRQPGPRSRLISVEHARVVSGTGGVIGVWPVAGSAPSMKIYAENVARMADAVGVDHVGIGSDMRGLLSPGAFEEYRQTPALADALLGAGFDVAGASKVLGGNYARVLGAVLPG